MGVTKKTFKELKNTPTEELEQLHDKKALHEVSSVDYYLGELRYREQSEISDSIKEMTSSVKTMTLLIVVFTIIMTVASVIQVFK